MAAVNSRGWIVGVLPTVVPALATRTTVVKLPGPDGAPGAKGWVRSISEDARVLGGQLYVDNAARAVRWTCR